MCILLGVSLVGCDFSDLNQAAEDFGIVVELDSIHTTSTVLVTDAKSNELTTEDVKVTFGGPTGDQVIDIYSDPLSERTVSSGVLNFGISNSVDPSENAPAKVNLRLEADGYVTTHRTVTIDREGKSEFSVEMIRKDDPPEGVEMETNNEGQASQDGAVQESYEVKARSENTSSGASMQVPEGTVFRDADGNPLTGELTTEVTYYDPLDPEAVKSIPMDMKNAEGQGVRMYSMMSIKITDSNGKMATTTTAKTPTVSIKSRSSENPKGYLKNAVVCIDTNLDNACNDHEAETMESSSAFTVGEQKGQFANAPTLVEASADVTFDQETEEASVKVPTDDLLEEVPQESSPTVAIGNELPSSTGAIEILRNGYEGSITAEISAPGYATTQKIAATARADNQASQRAKAEIQTPPQETLDYQINASHLENAITGTHNFAEQGDLEVELPEPSPGIIDATIEASLECENPDEKVAVTDIPSASVVYRKANAEPGTEWSVATGLEWDYDEESQELTGGRFDVSGVKKGTEYTFKLTYESKIQKRDITVSGESVTYTETVSGGVCN